MKEFFKFIRLLFILPFAIIIESWPYIIMICIGAFIEGLVEWLLEDVLGLKIPLFVGIIAIIAMLFVFYEIKCFIFSTALENFFNSIGSHKKKNDNE